MPLKMIRPTARTWLWAAAGLIAGGMVHIVTVLALPRMAADRMMAPALEATRLNEIVVLPPVTPETQVLPFMAPDVRYALCHYDLSAGALSVRTALLDGTWSIAIYDLKGRTVYTIAGADLQRREVDMLVTPSEDEQVGAIPIGKDRPASTVSVTVPELQGLLVIRAPVPGSSYAPIVDSALRQANCSIRAKGNTGSSATIVAPDPEP